MSNLNQFPVWETLIWVGRKDFTELDHAVCTVLATTFRLARISGHSSKMLGRNAAAATVLHTTSSIPVTPIRNTGGIGMMSLATVKAIANG